MFLHLLKNELHNGIPIDNRTAYPLEQKTLLFREDTVTQPFRYLFQSFGTTARTLIDDRLTGEAHRRFPGSMLSNHFGKTSNHKLFEHPGPKTASSCIQSGS